MPFLQAVSQKIAEDEVVVERDILGTFRHIFDSRLCTIGKNEITLLTIVQFIVFIIAFYLISRILRRFLRKQILPHLKFGDNIQFVVLRLTHYLIMLIGILIGLNSVGVQLTSLTVGVGVVGVGIAFGLQNVTSNFVSGIILLFERHVNVGDHITVENIVCRVIAINIRSTKVVTPDNTILIIPNSKFIEGIVTNWSVIDPKIRILISVRVGFNSDVQLVTDLLLQSAREHKDVLDDPAPAVFFKGYGEYGINFDLSVWIAQPDPKMRGRITSELYYSIDKLFRENEIIVPFQDFRTY